MNRPESHNNLIPVRDFKLIGNRGFPVSVQRIYKIISDHKAGTLKSPIKFKYKEIGKQIWIEE